MRNSEVVEAFLKRKIAVNNGGSLSSTGTKLFSYATCIAEWSNDSLIINLTKYSVTSSKHLYYLKMSCPDNYHAALGVPRGERSLSKYQTKLWELK
jgi:hypothetical protein